MLGILFELHLFLRARFPYTDTLKAPALAAALWGEQISVKATEAAVGSPWLC